MHRLHVVNDGGYIVEGWITFIDKNDDEISTVEFVKELFETKTFDIPNETVSYNLKASATTDEDNVWRKEKIDIYQNDIKFIGTEWAKDPIRLYHNEKYW